MKPGRRDLIALPLAALPVAAQAQAQAALPPLDSPRPVWPPPERFRLWPSLPPGAPPVLPRPTPEFTGARGAYHDIWMRGTAQPDVGVFRPTQPDGRCVLVIPGGGYGFVSLRGEGMDVAQALVRHGITAFVLNYRLPGEGWQPRGEAPLADAQRAMRLIRANARRWRIDPARLGVLGFSAGGHLAGTLATLHDRRAHAPVDAADAQPARPASAGLVYAVSNMNVGRSRGGSRTNLLGASPDPALVEAFAVERRLAAAPPLFLVHAEDDPLVPAINTLDLRAGAIAARVPVETHLFARGGHGFGARAAPTLPTSLWPELYARWLA